jgi:hypothetical protein
MDSPKIFLISEKTRFDLPNIDFDLKSGPEKSDSCRALSIITSSYLIKTKPNNYLEL